MNRQAWMVCSLLALATPAEACEALHRVSVSQEAMVRVPLKEALSRMLPGYTVRIEEAQSNLLVSGVAIKGVPADIVLATLSKKVGFFYRAEGCSLTTFGERESAATWKIQAHSSTLETLTRWGQTSGWQVSWEVADDYIVGANAAFDKNSFKEAAGELLLAIRDAGIPLEWEFASGNRVLRVFGRSLPYVKQGGNHEE